MGISTRLVVVVAALLLVPVSAQAQDFVWAAQLSGTEDVWPRDVAVDAAGNVYTVGRFYGTVDFDPGPGTFNLTSAGSSDAFVSALDDAGNFVWAAKLSGTDYVETYDVAVGAAGNVYIVGRFNGTVDFDPGPGMFNLTSAGDDDAFVSVLNDAGTFVWAAKLSGANRIRAYGIAVSASGNVYTVGYFEGTADFDPGPGTFNLTAAGDEDAFVTKLDGAGDFLWAVRWGGDYHLGGDSAIAVAIDANENVYTVGKFTNMADFDPGPGTFNLTSASYGYSDLYVSVLDSGSGFVWAVSFSGPYIESAEDVKLDAAGNVYTSGYFHETVDFDPGPGTFDLTAVGPRDAFVSMLDSTGNLVWAAQLGGAGYDQTLGMTVDPSGKVFTVGLFQQTADFDPGPGTFNLTSPSGNDGYLSVLDCKGDFLWAGQLGRTVYNAGADGVEIGAGGRVFVAGGFEGTVDLDPGLDTHFMTSAGLVDVYVLGLTLCGDYDDRSTYGMLLFPPACTLDASGLTQDVYDSTTTGVAKGSNDAFYLSSHGMRFDPLVVDDLVYCDGQDAGLGPYGYRPGVPPFVPDAPIEYNLLHEPAHDITDLVPANPSQVQFELLDSDRVVYGHTAVYLVRDCGVWVGENDAGQTLLNWVSCDVDVGGLQSNLDVASGMLSELRGDGDFSRACDIGSFLDTTQVVDGRADPPPEDGYYYLVNGTCAQPIGYGNSSAGPRQGLPPATTCP